MSRVGQWKRILGRSAKPQVPVLVDGKTAIMTDTQAYRFEELTDTGSRRQPAANLNPLEQSTYSLEDAAFRLMTTEADILERAASGSIRLYSNVEGLAGHWRRADASNVATESSLRTLRSGYLALPKGLCKELPQNSGVDVTAFEFPELADMSVLNIDHTTLQELSVWGTEKKYFCPAGPHRVERSDIVLLAPLV